MSKTKITETGGATEKSLKLLVLPKGEGIGAFQIVDNNGNYYCSVDAVAKGLPLPENGNRAALIVQAVNQFDALNVCVEALKDIMSRERWSCDVTTGLLEKEKDGPWVMVNHVQIEKALASVSALKEGK